MYLAVKGTKQMLRKRPEHLIHVELHTKNWCSLLELCVVPRGLVDGLGHKVEDEVEEDLVPTLAAGVEEVVEPHDVGVFDQPHDLELAVLKALVLQDFLDGDELSVHQRRLKHHAKGAVAHDSVAGVADLDHGLTRRRRLHGDYLVWVGLVCISGCIASYC